MVKKLLHLWKLWRSPSYRMSYRYGKALREAMKTIERLQNIKTQEEE